MYKPDAVAAAMATPLASALDPLPPRPGESVVLQPIPPERPPKKSHLSSPPPPGPPETPPRGPSRSGSSASSRGTTPTSRRQSSGRYGEMVNW